jgi:hypothetical protein
LWSSQFCLVGCLCLARELKFLPHSACGPAPRSHFASLWHHRSLQLCYLQKHETLTPARPSSPSRKRVASSAAATPPTLSSPSPSTPHRRDGSFLDPSRPMLLDLFVRGAFGVFGGVAVASGGAARFLKPRASSQPPTAIAPRARHSPSPCQTPNAAPVPGAAAAPPPPSCWLTR